MISAMWETNVGPRQVTIVKWEKNYCRKNSLTVIFLS